MKSLLGAFVVAAAIFGASYVGLAHSALLGAACLVLAAGATGSMQGGDYALQGGRGMSYGLIALLALGATLAIAHFGCGVNVLGPLGASPT
ncbi:MAG: hypothetical protein JO126_06640 [Alphaproteobacteria bacterium]|nr:hypothetical protein [Alphaproteobacteria bacterium]